MTALDVTATFIAKLSMEYPQLRKDFEVFRSHIRYCLNHGERGATLLTQFVGDLLRFSKAIVKGVNKGRLQFSCASLARKSSAVYPRFLSGLTAMVFNENGYLRHLYNKTALKLLLEILALLKRVKHKSTIASADRQGFLEFEEYQRKSRHVDKTIIPPLKALWSYLTKDILEYATLGYPGPGATLDELHPYSPRFSFVDPRTLPPACAEFYARAFENVTGEDIYQYQLPFHSGLWLDEPREYLADHYLPVYYPFVPSPQLKTVCVPKNVITSRAITIAPVGNTCMGATYRNSIKAMWKVHGIEHLINVHDQSLSHEVLRKYFKDLTLLDLEGGSSTLILDLLEAIVPDFLLPFFISLRGSTFETPNGVFPVTTLLMGDAIATAILSTTMFFMDLLAMYNHKMVTQPRHFHERIISNLTFGGEGAFIHQLSGTSSFGLSVEEARIPTYDQFLQLIEEARKLPIRNVGDDKAFPSYLEPFVRDNLSRIGTTINEDKSSTADSYHKETCGCWIISDGHELTEIYPFRAPEGDTKPLQLQSSTEFLQKLSKSPTINDLTVTLAYVYGNELTASSHRSDYAGSPVGSGLPCKFVARNDILLARVDDDLAYTFGLPTLDWSGSDATGAVQLFNADATSFDHFVPFRVTKRSVPARVRYRTFRDPSKPKGLRHPEHYEVRFNSNPYSNDPTTASFRAFEEWCTQYMGSITISAVEALYDCVL